MLLTDPGKLGKALDIELGFDWGDVGIGFPGIEHNIGKGMKEGERYTSGEEQVVQCG